MEAWDLVLKTLINATLSPSALSLVVEQDIVQGVWKVLEWWYTCISHTRGQSENGVEQREQE